MRIVVIGAAGVIGSRVVSLLAADGHRVVAVDRRRVGCPRQFEVEEVVTDLREDGADMSYIRPGDVIIHLAAIMGSEAERRPGEALRVNVGGSARVLTQASRVGARRVVVGSSVAVFGADEEYSPEQLPLDDNSPRLLSKGVLVYATSKLVIENLGKDFQEGRNLEVVGLRPGVVYGAGRDTGMVAEIVNLPSQAVKTGRVEVKGAQRSFTAVHVVDVARGFAYLATCESEVLKGRQWFNMSGDRTTISEFITAVRNVLPGVEVSIEDGQSGSFCGFPSQIRDRALEEELGFSRKYRSVLDGVEQEIRELRSSLGTGTN